MITLEQESQEAECVEIAKSFRSPLLFAEEFSQKKYGVDAPQWIRTPHLSVVDYEFQQLLETDKTDILIVTMPVRHGKSEYLAKWATAYHKMRYPHKNIMLTSNTSRLANKHSRWVRDTVHQLSPKFNLKGVDARNSSVSEWKLDGAGMGGCVSAGIGGSIVGMPADLLIIDDYLKDAKSAYSQTVRDAQWDWFISTSSTRLEPNGKIVLLCTRWHSDDLIGRILANRNELDFRVRYINMQAIRDSSHGKDPLGRQDGEALWPERWPVEVMERRKRQSKHWWYSIYQGRPTGSGMSSFPPEYFTNVFVDDADWPSDMVLSASALDPSKGKNSKGGDYQAAVYVGYSNGILYVDADLDRRAVSQMVRNFVQFNRDRKPAVTAIEGNAFQELLGEDYSDACYQVGYAADAPMMLNNTINKALRIERLGKFLDARMIRFRRAVGCELLVSQLKEFPFGTHDDGPDAMEMAIRALMQTFGALASMYDAIESPI